MRHLTDEELAAHVDGNTTSHARQHLPECAKCRDAAAELSRLVDAVEAKREEPSAAWVSSAKYIVGGKPMKITQWLTVGSAAAVFLAIIFASLLVHEQPPQPPGRPAPAAFRRGVPVSPFPNLKLEEAQYPVNPEIRYNVNTAAAATTTGPDITLVLHQGNESIVIVGLRRPAGGTLKVGLVNGDETTTSERKIKTTTASIQRFVFSRAPGDATLSVALGDETWKENLKSLEATDQEITIVTGERLIPGSRTTARVFVYGMSDLGGVALSGVDVDLSLSNTTLFRGKTDETGTAVCDFTIPDLAEGDHPLVARAVSRIKTSERSIPLKVKNEHKILLVTDKPLYQPGQEILLRALVLNQFDLKPLAQREMLFEIEDAKGNKVFKRKAATSEFGIAHARFQLADEVAMGDYKISATCGKIKTEKTATVKRYVLPRFEVRTDSEKQFYQPKETVKGTLTAIYTFGKPVVGAEVEIEASTFDVEFRKFATVKAGKTDADGKAEFEVALPDYFVGQPLDSGNGLVKIDIAVKDTAEHVEKKSVTWPVVSQPIKLTLVAESGRLVPDVENKLYLLATYPDGTPAEVAYTLRGPGIDCRGRTDRKSGFDTAAVTPRANLFRQGQYLANTGIFTPTGAWHPGHHYAMQVLDVEVTAADERGAKASRTFELSSDPTRDTMLLRMDKAVYKGGESVAMDVFTAGNSGSAFIDVIKNRQTLLTRAVDVEKGRAQFRWTLPPDLFGTIEVHAYHMLGASGAFQRDTRVVYVHPAAELKIAISPEKGEYRPRNASDRTPFGEETYIKFRVTDSDGAPVKSALGIIIVDTAVYALQEMQPGLEKVYFTLEEELRNPKYELKDAPLTLPVVLKEKERLEANRQEIAKAILAGVEPLTQTSPAAANAADALAPNVLQTLWQSLWGAMVGDRLQFTANGSRVDYADQSKEWIAATAIGCDPSLTYAKVMRLMPYFRPDAAADYVTAQRKNRKFQEIVIGGAQVLDPKSGKLTETVGRMTVIDALGKTFTVDELAKSDPIFAPDNIAKAVDNHRKQVIMSHLWTTIEDFTPLFTRDGARLAQDALRGVGLGEAAIRDAKGEIFQLGDIIPVDDLKKMMASKGWIKVNQSILQYLSENPSTYDGAKGMYLVPDNILDLCLRRGLDHKFLTDPWGQKVRFIRSATPVPHPLHGHNWNGTLTMAGPDRVWGTADDIATATYYVFPNGNWDYWDGNQRIYMANNGGVGGGGGRWTFSLGGRYQDTRLATDKMARPLPYSEAPSKDVFKEDEGVKKTPRPGGKMSAAEVQPLFVREWFPETLLFEPELVTDERGEATLRVKIADSITTWKLSASASSLAGKLGAAAADIRVFQDFFIEPDLPVALTQDDEIGIPVAVYNYLPETQRIRLVFQAEGDPWFDALDAPEKIVEIGKNEVRAVFFRIKARRIGDAQTLRVTAYGTRMSDAVKKSIRVEPNGKMIEVVRNDRLTDALLALHIPENAVDDASKILVKVYPGIYTQVLDGVEGILSAPHG